MKREVKMMDKQDWEQAGIDYEEGLQRMCGNETMYHKYLKKFLQDTSYQKLSESLEQGNIEDAKLWIHTLKGTSATLGFAKLAEYCKREEQKLKSGEIGIDMDVITKAYVEVQDAVKKLG
jgi:HPt (histidine-containing phosphotransfer) domain-containing protein